MSSQECSKTTHARATSPHTQQQVRWDACSEHRPDYWFPFFFFFYQALWDLHHCVIRSLFRGERWKNGCILYIIAIYKSDKKLTELGVFLFSPSVAGSRKVRLKYGASGSDVYYSFSIISSINPLKWGVYLVLQHPCFSPVHFQPPPSPLPHGQFCAIF